MKYLPIAGLSNCRNLGGFACDGGVTRYGVFPRGDAPCNVEDEGLARLRERFAEY